MATCDLRLMHEFIAGIISAPETGPLVQANACEQFPVMRPNYGIDVFKAIPDPVGVFQKFDCDSCDNVYNFYVAFVAAGCNVAAAGAVGAREDPDMKENFFLEESLFLGKIPHGQSAVFGRGHQKSAVGRKCHSGHSIFMGITKPVNLFVF